MITPPITRTSSIVPKTTSKNTNRSSNKKVKLTEEPDSHKRYSDYAIEARLPKYKTSDKENEFISQKSLHKSKKIFLGIRNRILKIWYLESHRQILLNDLDQIISEKFSKSMVITVYEFLVLYNYINFGILQILPIDIFSKRIQGNIPKPTIIFFLY